MTRNKIQDTRYKKSLVLVIGHWLLVIIWLLSLGYWSFAAAMGGSPPTSPEAKSKYKLQVLKMELVPASSVTQLNVAGKKALMVIAPKNFQDKEFSIPKGMLEKAGVKVTVASADTDTATGMYGSKVKPDISIKNAKASNYDAIIFIGGSGATVYKFDPNAHSLAIEAKKHGKVVGAICLAPVILAKAGVLEGKKATGSPAGLHLLLEGKAKVFKQKNVVVDGKIITGSGPEAAEEFGKTILNNL
jgi:protease I